MKEKEIQTLFGKEINIPGVFELKLCKGNAMPYDAVKDHQIKGLLDVKGEGLFHKISDSPIFAGMKTRFTKPKPFDCMFIKEYPAYVVICFYVPKQPKAVYIIDIDDFIKAKKTDTRKSITREKALLIAKLVMVI